MRSPDHKDSGSICIKYGVETLHAISYLQLCSWYFDRIGNAGQDFEYCYTVNDFMQPLYIYIYECVLVADNQFPKFIL